MPEFISRQDWLRLEIDAADQYVERHGADDDPIQRAHAQRRGREAVKHRAELASLDAPTGAATSPATTATSPRDQTNRSGAGQDLVGRYVTVRYPGPYGVTTMESYITDVSIDGDEVEVAAALGHLFPLDTVTFTDDDEPDVHVATHAAPASEPPTTAWAPPDPFATAPGAVRPLAPPGTVSIDVWRDADPRRRGAEVGYGDFWTFDDPNDGYSIVWNVATGELYTYRQKDRTVLVRAVIPTRAAVDALLHGWQRDQFEECSGYCICGHVATRRNAVSPPSEASPPTARDIALSWHQAPPPSPAEPPLGLA